jgi:ATP-dependent RNA helicase RhlE
MAQNQRQRAIDGFRRGEFDILVATDIAARGIDVAEISHVINYDMPDTADAYIHRSGRTGRAQLTGEALTLTVPSDEATVREIERALGTRLERRRLPDFDYGGFVPEKQPAAYPSTPQRGNYNARSMNRPMNNGANHGTSNGANYGSNYGRQRPATSYKNTRPVPANRGGNGESYSGNGYANNRYASNSQSAGQSVSQSNSTFDSKIDSFVDGASEGNNGGARRRRPGGRFLPR